MSDEDVTSTSEAARSVSPLLRRRRLGVPGSALCFFGPAGASGGSGCGRPSSATVGFWVLRSGLSLKFANPGLLSHLS